MTTTRPVPVRTAPSRVRDVVRIHRLEFPFPISYLAHAAWGACLGVSGPAGLLSGPVLLAMAANLLLVIAQNPLNAAIDISADARVPGKSGIGAAAARLGHRTAAGLGAGEMALGLAMAAVASAWLGSPAVLLVLAFRVALDLLYNLRPVRLKGRGFANPITLGLVFGTLPTLASYSATGAPYDASIWLVAGGLGVLVTGRTLWFALSDMRADAAAGDRTPVVRYGVYRALILAGAITVPGLALIAAGFGQRYGPAVATLVTATSGALLVYVAYQFRAARRGELPEYRAMLYHALTLVAVADVILLVAPFLG
jgi:4-hydroxybenzoate polyprenyltransferase